MEHRRVAGNGSLQAAVFGLRICIPHLVKHLLQIMADGLAKLRPLAVLRRLYAADDVGTEGPLAVGRRNRMNRASCRRIYQGKGQRRRADIDGQTVRVSDIRFIIVAVAAKSRQNSAVPLRNHNLHVF